jgi:hypothetical protein
MVNSFGCHEIKQLNVGLFQQCKTSSLQLRLYGRTVDALNAS